MAQDYSDFANLLNSLLNEHDRSQGWLARKLGCHPAQISRWLGGNQRPGGKNMILEIGRIFKLQMAELDELLVAANYPPKNYSAQVQNLSSERSQKRESKLIVIFDEQGVKVIVEGEDLINLAPEEKGKIVNIVDLSLEQVVSLRQSSRGEQFFSSIKFEFSDEQLRLVPRMDNIINVRPPNRIVWESQ